MNIDDRKGDFVSVTRKLQLTNPAISISPAVIIKL